MSHYISLTLLDSQNLLHRAGMSRPLVLLAIIFTVSIAVWCSQGSPEGQSEASEFVSDVEPSTGQPGDNSGEDQVAVEDTPESSSTETDKTPETIQDLLVFAEELRDSIQSNVQDYTAILVKRERIGGKLYDESRMQLKIRNPLDGQQGVAAYLKFMQPDSVKGREVIWVAGKNNDKLLAHDAGFKRMMGTLSLDPEGRLAMMGQKYPIYEVGIMRLVEKLIEKGKTDALQSQATISVDENKKVGGKPCRMIQVTLPKGENVDFHVARIYVDMQRMVPLRYAAFLWPTTPGGDLPLEEEYTYLDMRLNVGLDEEDFDPANPAYDFP